MIGLLDRLSVRNSRVNLFAMSTVQDIESAIRQLSPAELAALRAWLAEFDADAWDREISADAQSGRLDAFYQHLQKENEGQPEIPLHEVLDHEKLS